MEIFNEMEATALLTAMKILHNKMRDKKLRDEIRNGKDFNDIRSLGVLFAKCDSGVDAIFDALNCASSHFNCTQSDIATDKWINRS